jgi:flagellar basal body-associated protein FliL
MNELNKTQKRNILIAIIGTLVLLVVVIAIVAGVSGKDDTDIEPVSYKLADITVY